MKFAIIGAGSVGMLLAALLTEAGAVVQLLTRRPEQASLINRSGISKNGKRFRVAATVNYEDLHPDAFVLVAVKYDGLEEVLPNITRHCPSHPVVFLQNGMLHLEKINRMTNAQVAVGSVEHGTKKISDDKIVHAGNGKIKFALVKGREETFKPLLQLDGVRAEWHKDADWLLFRKTLLNCMINPLTALMEINNGELLTNVYAYELLRNLYTELYGAFPEIEAMLPFEQVTALCASTGENRSSMLSDKLAGRAMELDTILLYTINRAPRELPQLQAFYHLLKSAEV